MSFEASNGDGDGWWEIFARSCQQYKKKDTSSELCALYSVPFILWKCEVEACSVLLPRQQTAGGSVSTTDSISPRQSMFCVPFGLEIIQGIKNDVCSLTGFRPNNFSIFITLMKPLEQ